MNREIELKLEAAPEAIERLTRESWIERVGCRSQDQVSIYYDTPDGELRSRGYTLRVRSAGDRFIQTVKSLDSGAGLFERGEWEYQIAGPEPDAEVLASTPLAGFDVNDLRAVIRSDVNRTARRLLGDAGEISLDIDEGRISAAGGHEPVSEIEIELVRGTPACVVDVAKRIATAIPVKLGVMSKAERGFALADGKLGKVVKAEPVAIDAEMTVAEGFEAIVGACIRHFRLNEALVIEQRLPEALHQTRVAMRRLRAAMSLFRTAIADEEFANVRSELRWFTAQLGDARNLDVFLERDLPPEQRRTPWQNREAAYDRVVEAMDSRRFRSLMIDLVAWAALGSWREHTSAGMPIEPYVNRRIDRLWHKINAADHLPRMDDEERHQLRILIKKLRYALEFVAQVHAKEGERQKKFGRALQDLQETLGLLNDAVVARTMVMADAWPIVPEEQNDEERRLLHDAAHDLDRLQKAGPYWR